MVEEVKKKKVDKRVITPMPDDLLELIETYRSSQRPIPSQAEAIRDALRKYLTDKVVPK